MAVILQAKGPLAKLVVGNQFLIDRDVLAQDVSIADAGNYYDSNNVEGALQEVGADLEANATAIATNTQNIADNTTAIEANATAIAGLQSDFEDLTASEVAISDAGNYYASNEIEGALQEIGADLANVQNLTSGQGVEIAGGVVNIGAGDALTTERSINIGAGGGLSISKVGGGFSAGFFPEDGLIEFSVGSSNLVLGENGANANRFTSDIQTLSISGGLIAWNMALGQRAKVTLTANATLSNPTNATAAFPDLEVRQDATGGRVLSFGSDFVLPVGFTAPPTTLNSYTLYHFQLRSDGKFAVVATPYAT